MISRFPPTARWGLLAWGPVAVLVLRTTAALAEPPVNAVQTVWDALDPVSMILRYELGRDDPQGAPRNPTASGAAAKRVEEVPLTLQAAASLALLNNREIRVERLGPRIREQETQRERAAFHPSLVVDGSTDSGQTASASLLAGTTTPETESAEWNSAIRTKLITGAVASLEFKNRRLESNSKFQTLDPLYTSSLAFTLTQPLLRDFGPNINQTRIKIARNSLDISQHQVQVTTANVLAEVESVYWDLVLALEDLNIRRRSLELTGRLTERTRALVAEGRLPEIAMLQARAAVVEKENDVLVAETAVGDARARLREVLNLDPGADLAFVPLDKPTAEVRVVDLQQAQQAALANRAELQQAKLDLDNKQLALRYAKNQTLPQLNLVGSYGLSGTAGSSTLEDLDPRIQAILARRGIELVAPSTQGGYGTSLENLFSGDFPSWKVGFTLTIPLGNVAARSELRKAELELERAELNLKSLERRIALEVEKLASQLQVAPKQIEASRLAREHAERRLEMAQEQFQLGLAPMTALTEAERDLASAERGVLRAIVDYTKLLALFDKAVGVTLDKFGVGF